MLRRLMLLPMVMWAVPATAQIELTKEVIHSLVAQTNRYIKESYAYPEKADEVTRKLSQSLASGRYAVDDPVRLAALLTEDMRAVTNDKHMFVGYRPADASRAGGNGGGGDFAERMFAAMMVPNNYGILEMKVLPGNVRYINLAPAWLWDPQKSPQVFDDAMRFLKGGEAYIIDVRSNNGGSREAVRYVTSHFLDPDTKIMNYKRPGQPPWEDRTHAVPEGKLDKPLYVLTSPASGSGSESFAAHIKNFKLGTLVGATTAGASNGASMRSTKEGFFIGVTDVIQTHPVTNQGWEGIGIAPDIAVPVPLALDVAHLEALNRLKAKASGAALADLQWQIDIVAAKAKPVKLSQEELSAYAGGYGEKRKVVAENGKLYWHDGPNPAEMLPFGNDLFGFVSGPNIRLKFDRQGGTVTGVTQLPKLGKPQSFPRSLS